MILINRCRFSWSLQPSIGAAELTKVLHWGECSCPVHQAVLAVHTALPPAVAQGLGFRVIGQYRGYIGIMEKRKETTIWDFRFRVEGLGLG